MSSALPPSGGGTGDNNNNADGEKNNNNNKTNGNGDDDKAEKNSAASSASALGNELRRRRPRPASTGYDDDDEEESKAEIESLAAASGFGTDGRTDRKHHNDHHHPQTVIADCPSQSQSRPGAYAVDGPDHPGGESQSSLFGSGGAASSNNSGNVVLGLDDGASDDDVRARARNPNGMENSSSTPSSGRRSNANHGTVTEAVGGSSSRRGGSTRSVHSAQSGQSENSAVEQVRAALDAEERAARASGMGTRRPSLISSMTSGAYTEGPGGIGTRSSSHRRTSSITAMSTSASGAGAAAAAAAAAGAGAGTNTTNANTGSGDLANHPDIEFLAEATLVVDSTHDDDGDAGDDHDGKDPPPDYEEVVDYEDGADVSTLGPPVELSPSTNNNDGRQRRSSAGTSSTRGGGRRRRSARPTDSYADVPEATCTSVDESNHRDRSRTGTPSRTLTSSSRVIDGSGQETTSPFEIEEGTGASQPSDSDILVAEPLKDKCLLPRRTVVVGFVVGLVLMLAVALGVAIPLSKRDGGPTPSPPDGGGGNATYPAFSFNPPNSEVLTNVPEPICFSLLPIMTNVSKVCTDPVLDLPKGGPMDQLIADGLLSASDPAAKIDIALINGGAFRSDIFAGELTAGFVRKMVMPFTNNRVAYLSITPAEIYETLNGALFDTGFVVSEEQQAQFFPESPTVKLGWPYESTYPYAAGLRYDVDLNAPEGQKATNVRIHPSSSYGERYGDGFMAEAEKAEDGWILLDPADDTTLIRVLSSDYLASGGDGFFQTVPEDRIEILDALGITQLFMYYCSLQSELVGPNYVDEMSTRNFVPLDGYENDP